MLDGSRNPMNSSVGDPVRPTTHRVWWAGAAVLTAALALTIFLTTRRHQPPAVQPSATAASSPANPAAPSPPAGLPEFEVDAVSVLEGDANWYDVPEDSLPQRRAWSGEMTAASNRLPRDAYVRVRRLDSKGDPDKTVVVRITDNGVSRKNTVIDLDRPAAAELGMVKAGQVRVRVEVLALKHADANKPVEKKDSPAAAKASTLTDQPTASEQQEKAAAKAKTGGGSPP